MEADKKILNPDIAYQIGNFRLVLDEETGILNIMVLPVNKDRVSNIMIRPIVANAVNLIACK